MAWLVLVLVEQKGMIVMLKDKPCKVCAVSA